MFTVGQVKRISEMCYFIRNKEKDEEICSHEQKTVPFFSHNKRGCRKLIFELAAAPVPLILLRKAKLGDSLFSHLIL